MTRRSAGFTLMEIALMLALGAIVMGLVGALFVASLSTWRRGQEVREAQVQANTLIDIIAKDIREASQTVSVVVRPQVAVDDGDPLLAITAASPSGAGGGPASIIYVHRPSTQEVIREIRPAGAGRPAAPTSRVVATGVTRMSVEQVGGGVTIEVEVRRGRATAQGRGTAVPRNP
ncbi:MAG: hypothetical protein HY355_00140 [Armatimonadetes bacterium]|nr:hypothetical protein [Armatimonadota bacterium]